MAQRSYLSRELDGGSSPFRKLDLGRTETTVQIDRPSRKFSASITIHAIFDDPASLALARAELAAAFDRIEGRRAKTRKGG